MVSSSLIIMESPVAPDLSADELVFKKNSQIYFHTGVDVFSQNIELSLASLSDTCTLLGRLGTSNCELFR